MRALCLCYKHIYLSFQETDLTFCIIHLKKQAQMGGHFNWVNSLVVSKLYNPSNYLLLLVISWLYIGEGLDKAMGPWRHYQSCEIGSRIKNLAHLGWVFGLGFA